MLGILRYVRTQQNHAFKYLSINCENNITERFEPVFSFPFIKYFALFNRLKVYHLAGTGIGLPTCGLLEASNIIPPGTFSVASYIGVTAATLLGLSSIPFHNIIGFIYISDDNKKIKIASVNYWGTRKDRIVSHEDWIPMFDLKTSVMDAIYLSPRLTDGTKFKLFLKFGQIKNLPKMNAVLD